MKNKKAIKSIVTMLVMVMAFCITGITVEAAGRITQTDQTKNSVTISWVAEQNAIEYYVSIGKNYDEAKSATPITVPATTTSYTFNNLQEGTEYYVRIQYKYKSIYSDNTYIYSLSSDEIKTLPGKVSGLNQTKWWYYIKSVDFAWNDQSGVDGYEYIVKYNKKTFSEGTTSSHSTGISKVSNNKVYNVTVRAYVDINGKTYYGEWSDKAYLFTQPMVKSAKVSGKKLKIVWNKVSGVSSYDVYVSTKEKSGYKKVKTVSSKKTSVTVSKLKGKKFNPKKTYYIYIVGKKKVGGKTYTSGRHYTYKITKTKNGKNGTLRWTFN